jgi:glycosyltransferase involved in cell wall biosynthesis
VNHIAGDINYVALGLPGSRTVVTVHDLNRIDQLVGLRKKLYLWFYFSLPLRRCRFVTAVSEHTRDRLLELYPWIESKLRVIHNCVPGALVPSPKLFDPARPRILQVGTQAHKNLGRVVQALSGLSCVLHIIGRLSEQQRVLLERCQVQYENSADVCDSCINAAYRDADLVVFAALSEGFGLPIIEAQAIGRPVLTSDLSPMKEVAGGAACLVNPRQIGQIRAGLQCLIENDTYRRALIQKGYANVDRFRPQLIASEYLDLYREVLAG